MATASTHDDPASALRRAAQADPYVQYLILPRRAQAAAPASLFQAAVRATIDCRERYGESPEHAANFSAWAERSFRKVCLRARESQWNQLLEDEDLVLAGGEDAVVACLPPILRSRRAPLLGKLQAVNAEFDSTTVAPTGSGSCAARFIINHAAQMSLGKLIAQVAHASLMLADSTAGSAWIDRGAEASFEVANESDWDVLRAEKGVIVVRDAGLTEVEAGTETILALPLATRS